MKSSASQCGECVFCAALKIFAGWRSLETSAQLSSVLNRPYYTCRFLSVCASGRLQRRTGKINHFKFNMSPALVCKHTSYIRERGCQVSLY